MDFQDIEVFSISLKFTFLNGKSNEDSNFLIRYGFIEKCLKNLVLHIILEGKRLELVCEELNHLAAILHVYAGDLIFMK